MKKLIPALGIFALLCSCSGNSEHHDSDTTNKPKSDSVAAFDLEKVKSHISEANAHYSDRFKSNDPAFYSSHYTSNACVLSPDTSTVCGLDNIRSFYYGGGVNQSVSVIITAGDVYGTKENVIEEGSYDVKDEKGTLLDHGKFIAIWKEESGSWKLHREIWNSDGMMKK